MALLPASLRIAAAAAMLAGAAHADPPTWPGPLTPGVATESLPEFVARQRAEAGVALRAISRDADRAREEAWIRSQGSREDVQRYEVRIRGQDALDRLVDLQTAAPLPPGAGYDRFGPVTRRLLERSRVELLWTDRRGDDDRRVRELERAVEARPAANDAPLRPPDPIPDSR